VPPAFWKVLATILLVTGVGAAVTGLVGLIVDSDASVAERTVFAIAGVGYGVVACLGAVALWRFQRVDSN